MTPMDYNRRSEEEENFERLCVGVASDEFHEQEAIEYFEQQMGQPGFDATRWLDVALYFSPGVSRGIIEMVSAEDKAASAIDQAIADNLDISYDEQECEQFADTIEFALNTGVALDLDVVRNGCQRALDDMQEWAGEDEMAPLLRLRDAIDGQIERRKASSDETPLSD
jgi:hypothetical protein